MATRESGGSGLRRYLLTRLALAPLFLFVLLTALFILLRVAPGDPVVAALGGRATPERIEAARESAGLNDPILVQYGRYLANVVQGDLGNPITDPRSVTEIIAARFPATLELTVFALIVAGTLGVLIGAFSAQRRDTVFDVGGRLLGIVVYAAPVFWTGILAQLLFANRLELLPTGNRLSARIVAEAPTGFYVLDGIITGNGALLASAIEHLILPGVTLGLLIGGVFIRMVRVNMLQTLRADYVEAAQARGVSQNRVLFQHAFRNALIPIITIMGLQAALLLGGAILTETTFSWPGVGSALVDFIHARDYAAVQGIATFFALLVFIISLAIDIANGIVDPRVRY
jgi:peptide/nickel transport system permease protein